MFDVRVFSMIHVITVVDIYYGKSWLFIVHSIKELKIGT